jgi:hypothetical protein
MKDEEREIDRFWYQGAVHSAREIVKNMRSGVSFDVEETIFRHWAFIVGKILRIISGNIEAEEEWESAPWDVRIKMIAKYFPAFSFEDFKDLHNDALRVAVITALSSEKRGQA